VTIGQPGATAADIGRRRRLLRLGGERGIVAGIAIDHRDSLRVALERRGLGDLTTDDLRELKVRLARALAPAATAIMLDAELGGLALEQDVVPPTVALIMPLEAQGYEESGDERITSLLSDFSPADALRYGADACKLLVPYRADDEPSASRQGATVRSTASACHEVGLPLLVEPVVFRRSTEPADEHAAAYERLVIGAVTRLQPLGVDLFKLPFPVPDGAAVAESTAMAACRSLHEACRGTPWVLLGAGVDTSTFVDQVRLAGMAGASGFLAGRGIWGPALVADPDEAERLAAGSALDDLERCRAVADRFARPIDAPDPG
jgi:tagatose-1,6-bisphosphate aldolase